MTYPTVVLVLGILSASFMLIFIFSILTQMFLDLGGTLPLPTRKAMGASDLLTSIWGVFIYASPIGGVVFFLRGRKTENGRKAVDPIMLKLFVEIGDMIQKVVPARFARTLGTLSAAGVPILQSLAITATSAGTYVVENALLKSRERFARVCLSTSRSKRSGSSRQW